MTKRGKSYLELLEESLPSKDHPNHLSWKIFALEAIERGKSIVEVLQEFTSVSGKKILDVGCGEGGISIAFAQASSDVVSIDVDIERVEKTIVRAQENGAQVSALVGNTENLGFHKESFDIVILADVIEHVLGPEKAIAEILRALKPDGYLYVSTPNRISPRVILRDPHWGLFGLSLMPRDLASWYVCKIRKRASQYDVGYLFTLWGLRRLLKDYGLVEIYDIHSFKKGLEKLNNPSLIISERRKKIGRFLQRAGLNTILSLLLNNRIFDLLLRHFFIYLVPGWSVIASPKKMSCHGDTGVYHRILQVTGQEEVVYKKS